jgi:leader peptidase (prepilin peptidase)/N-methyltransferase
MIGILAAAGVVVGALLPLVIARLPDRVAADDGQPPPLSHRELASTPGLALRLALITAIVWAAVGLARLEETADLPAYLLVAAAGVAMSYIDIRDHRLPDWLTLSSLIAAGGLLAIAAAVTPAWSDYGRAWAAALGCLAFYLMLALLRPADLGLGDVKLAAVVGLLLGWVGWSTVVLGIFLGFVVGGVAGLILLVSGRANRRSAIPFGPLMLVGALSALLWAHFAANF